MKLPLVLIIENNQYALTPVPTGCNNFHERLYGIPGVTIDGTDVELVYRVKAIEHAKVTD